MTPTPRPGSELAVPTPRTNDERRAVIELRAFGEPLDADDPDVVLLAAVDRLDEVARAIRPAHVGRDHVLWLRNFLQGPGDELGYRVARAILGITP